MKVTGICLITDNVRALAEFYTQALGVTADINDVHVALETEGAGIAIFSTQGMEEIAPGSMKGAGTGRTAVMLQVPDVDAHFERISRMGAEILLEPKTHPWGSRAFWFKDPDGNIVDFFSRPAG